MVPETEVQFQVESYQRLKKWYLMPPCLTLSIIRYGSRVSGAIQGKELHLTPYLSVVAIEKGAFGSPSITVSQLNKKWSADNPMSKFLDFFFNSGIIGEREDRNLILKNPIVVYRNFSRSPMKPALEK